MSLSQDGPDQFLQRASEVAYIDESQYLRPLADDSLGPGKTLSFHDFIWCICKYTKPAGSPVSLDAEIVPDDINHRHRVEVWGICDPGLRAGEGARFLRGRQEGFWFCYLEDALQLGVQAEEISAMRHALNLIPKYKFSNTQFFKRRSDFY